MKYQVDVTGTVIMKSNCETKCPSPVTYDWDKEKKRRIGIALAKAMGTKYQEATT